MISEKIQKAINKQINEELFSSYLYLAMEAYFQSQNLSGMATWMRAQTQEEIVHAMKFYKYVNERGGRVELLEIKQPQKDWSSPLEVFEAAYKHEQYITQKINGLVDLAQQEKDHATVSFLQWYVNEQVEEEASAGEVVQKVKLAKDAPGAMFMMDQHLGQRLFNQSPNEQGE